MVIIKVQWTEAHKRTVTIELPENTTGAQRLKAALDAARDNTHAPCAVVLGTVRWEGNDRTFGGRI